MIRHILPAESRASGRGSLRFLLPFLIAALSLGHVACGSSSTAQKGGDTLTTAPTPPVTTAPQQPQTPPNRPQQMSTISGINYIDEVRGTGPFIENGMTVLVDYAGYLVSGELFDTSIDSVGKLHNFDRHGYPFQPLEFTVGTGDVIRGWDEGLTTDMRVGGKRRLVIPPNLAYGPRGRSGIPPNATLIFDIHVLSARRP